LDCLGSGDHAQARSYGLTLAIRGGFGVLVGRLFAFSLLSLGLLLPGLARFVGAFGLLYSLRALGTTDFRGIHGGTPFVAGVDKPLINAFYKRYLRLSRRQKPGKAVLRRGAVRR
jgi:hypothetical protein